jgi:hypothetical protein
LALSKVVAENVDLTPPNDGSDRIRALEVVIEAIDRARTVGTTQETIASEMDNFAHTTDRTKDDLP